MKEFHFLTSCAKIIFFLFLGAFLLCFGSCKKKDSRYNFNNNIIPQVNNYSSVFCKINDSNWCDCMPLGQGFKTSGVYADYFLTYQNRPLEMRIRDYCDTNYRSFFFYINEFTGVGKYILASKPSYAKHEYFLKILIILLFLVRIYTILELWKSQILIQ
jgi:hypothetical protein